MDLGRWLLVILLLAGWGQTAKAQDGGEAPNVVLILADDLGYGDLSSYGANDLETPHIDSLVASGMRFNQFYANSSVCSPTRAALLSGRYPGLVGVPGVIRTYAEKDWGYLDPEALLLSTLLRRGGYHTGMVGKWHLGLESPNTPPERGFDYFQGFLGDMMDDYYTHRRRGLNYMREGQETIDPEGHATDLFTDWAVTYVRERSESEAPFFLYLAYNAPHAPIQPPEAWLEKVKQRTPILFEKRAKIAALIEHMDHGIGQIVETLKEMGAYDNTLIIFTSDNGGAVQFGSSNSPLRGNKGGMYDGGLRVPMAAVWPGHIEAGARSEVVTSTVDVFPTIAEAADTRLEHVVDGRSILPVLLGRTASLGKRTVFFVRREGRLSFMGQAIYAVRSGPWKLLQNTATGPFELYNLEEDPQEQNDVSEEHPEKFQELADLLMRHVQEAGEAPWQKTR